MKKFLPILLASLLPAVSLASTNEVLVLTTPTEMPRLAGSKAIEIQNLGPNPIFCALDTSAKAVLNKARRVDSGSSWALTIPSQRRVYCVATANQVTGAASIVTNIRR